MSIETIREAIEAALSEVDGLRVQQEWGSAVNASGNATAAVVEFAGATYDSVMGGGSGHGQSGDDLTFNITLVAGKASDRMARKRLDALVDPDPDSATSVRNNLPPTLSGAVAWAIVRSASGYREYGDESQPMLGCELTVGVAT